MRKLALILLTISLTGCANSTPVIHAVDTFCTRVDRYHVGDDADQLKQAARAYPAVTRLVRWAFGVTDQWDKNCLAPAKGA